MTIQSKAWTSHEPPLRILVIRLQAMGDVVITLPYIQQLRRSLPGNVRLDFLTRKETESIPRSINLFDNVFSIGGGRNLKLQLVSTILLLPRLWMQRYDIVIDLQNNELSRLVRKTIIPRAWSQFDRFSPIAAGERNRFTIEAAGIGNMEPDFSFSLKDAEQGIELLKNNGWNGTDDLVVLNPAGVFETRNWPLTNYIGFANLWLQHYPATKFVIIGISHIREKAILLEQALGNRFISLVDETTPAEAFAILQQVKLVISEDSGLMHMAWVSGIPTLALFGGTRSDWSRPLGEHSFFLDSSDLPCGNCMQATCCWGDVRCLTRYSAEKVFTHAQALVQKKYSGIK